MSRLFATCESRRSVFFGDLGSLCQVPTNLPVLFGLKEWNNLKLSDRNNGNRNFAGINLFVSFQGKITKKR